MASLNALDVSFNILRLANPIELFWGKGFSSLYEAAVRIFDNQKQLAKGNFLLDSLEDVFSDSVKIMEDFQLNREKFPAMEEIMTLMKNADPPSLTAIKVHSEEFIKLYGAYTPQVSRARLAKNDALWASFKGAACGLHGAVENKVAILATLPSAVKLACENLDGTLAEMATLRENLFDFQFELIDTFARVARGSLGKAGADKDFLYTQLNNNKKSLFLGFFKTQVRVQTEAAAYCNKLEYMNQGHRVSACKPRSGLLSKADFDELVAYNSDISYHLEERFVYVPKTSQFAGDTGFIDMKRLAT